MIDLIDCWFRRSRRLTGAGDTLDIWTLASGWAAHAVTNLRGIHVEFGEGAAKGVAVHAKLFCGFALVSLVVRKYFEDVALLELTNGLRVRDAGAMHLSDQSVHFALQGYSSLVAPFWNHSLIVPLPKRFDPVGRVVLELRCAVQNLLLKVVRYNEGYRMRPRKEIGR
jgi:hypothetical protein